MTQDLERFMETTKEYNLDSDFCSKELQPMAQWLAGSKLDCQPCVIGLVVDYYLKELDGAEEEALADALARIADREETSARRLATELDAIKDKVDSALREKLLMIDCTAQSYVAQEQDGEAPGEEAETDEEADADQQ